MTRSCKATAHSGPRHGGGPDACFPEAGKYHLRFEDRTEIKECIVSIEADTVSRVDMRALQKTAE